jgi:hypothetical protein
MLKDLPVEVADKILIHHISPMISVSEAMKSWVCVHREGGYIPRGCVCLDGSCGLSGHDFDKYGAVDYTCNAQHFDDLIYYLIRLTKYSRIAIDRKDLYIHCDYSIEDERIIMEKQNGEWVVISSLK